MSRCEWCAGPLPARATGRGGRVRVTCSARCRQARARHLRAVWAGVRTVRIDTRDAVYEQGALPLDLLAGGAA
ncbi:MAG: hypothetical protein ACRCYU_03300 [Nocardioides sp.]